MKKLKKRKDIAHFCIMTENIRFLSIKENGLVLVNTCVQNYSMDDGPDIKVQNVEWIDVTADFTLFNIRKEN